MNILKSVFFRVEHLRKVAIRYNNPEDGTDYLDIRYYNDDYCYGILRVNNKGKVEKIDLDKYAENGLDEDVYRDAMLELDADYEDINTDNPWESAKEVVKADKIIVMDAGRVNGFGSHDELLATNEIYRDVYESQQGGSGDFDKE
jgi:hypothetical protein